MRIVFENDGAQAANLIFGDKNVEDVDRLTGVLADAFVARDAAVQIHQDLVLHFLAHDLCDDGHFHVDVLHVEFVHSRCGNEGEENGVDGCGQAERHGADRIEHQVPQQIDVADARVGAAFDEHHAKKVHAARGAAHPKKKPNPAAAEKAANQASGELVAGENIGARDERKEDRCTGDGQERLQNDPAVKPLPGKQQ